MAGEGDEFVVGALLGDTAAVDDHDALRAADRRESVADDHARDAVGQLEEAVIEVRLGANIEMGGRLVQHEHTRSAAHRVEGAGERDALPLAARQISPALVLPAQRRRPTSVEGGDDVGDARVVGDLGEGRVVGLAMNGTPRDVLGGRQREAHEVLKDRRHAPVP